MVDGLATELLLIRHAPSHPTGHLYGRTDVAADVADSAAIAGIRQVAGDVTQRLSSPALRCRQTMSAIWRDDVSATEDPRLWEQDFGEWDGLAYADVPDIGTLAPQDLARHRPPGGETFEDVCKRVRPALLEAVSQVDKGRFAIVAHAGVVRAALALALDHSTIDAPAVALSFEVQPLSMTVLRMLGSGAMSIVCTNWRPS